MTATTDRLDTAAEVNGIPQVRHLNTAVPGPVSQSLQMRKLAAVANGIGTTLPVFIERAGGGIVVDVDGNSLIDLGSGIAVTTVGNANPEVAAAVQKQAAAFTHTCFTVTPYLGYVEVCEELNRLTPGTHEKRSALFNSGAEAVENAIKVARSFTRRNAVVVLEHAYHGRTNLTMGMTAKNMPYKNSFGPFAPEIYRVPMSYPYRDGGATGAEIAEIATTRIEKEIGADNVAVFLPVLATGSMAAAVACLVIWLALDLALVALAAWLGRHPTTERAVERVGPVALPLLYLAIGVVVLVRAGTFTG